MRYRTVAPRERTLRLAHDFLEETRRDLEKALSEGADLPPRIRIVHERAGHATPEYRTLAVPIPEGAEGGSPEVLSTSIARFAAPKQPHCLLLTLDVLGTDARGRPASILIAEARDRLGTRLFFVQPFRVDRQRITWDEPADGGWRDPGQEEMILDAAFG